MYVYIYISLSIDSSAHVQDYRPRYPLQIRSKIDILSFPGVFITGQQSYLNTVGKTMWLRKLIE